ncbi:MAG: nucleoside hydrolase [Bacteroidota bacterium]
MQSKIIIDTDPGVDDALAIEFALNAKELEVIGLSTVFGNVDVDLATINALRLLDLAKRADVPIARGTAHPLEGRFSGGVPFVHGDDGQGNTWQPKSQLQAIEQAAVDFIIEQIKRYPNEVTIAALGPLTNLALALQKAPEVQDLVKAVVLMGGNPFGPGNATPAGEANILGDPRAADIVFGARWQVTMIPLDVTHTIMLHENRLKNITKKSKRALHQHVMSAYIFYQDFYKRANNISGSYIHDSSVIAYLLHPDLFTSVPYPIRVEINDGISKGKTWPALQNVEDDNQQALLPWRNRPKVNVCTAVDSTRMLDVLEAHLY